MSYFGEQGWLILGIVVLFLFSAGGLLTAGYFLRQLLKESMRLEEQSPRLLRKWLEQYFREEGQIGNREAFVDKALQEYKVGIFTLFQLRNLSGQALLSGVFLSGVGACRGIIAGSTLGEILPFYLICLLGLYGYFSVSGIVNLEEKKEMIKTNLLYFLENQKPFLWGNSQWEKEAHLQSQQSDFGEQEEEQLKELLKEILA